MKYIYNLAFKMSISATIALLIGNALGLQYATVGAVIAILSIQDTRKKALIISYKRIIACSMGTIALLIGNALGLQYATVGAVIAILSIQDTRKKALIISYKRIIACSMGILLSVILYSLLGNGTLIFGLFLIILIPLTSRLKAQEGMVPSVVLSTHFLVANNITIELIYNEVLLMIIGIGVAAIANIFMPSLEDKFKDDKEWIEEHYRIIINKMSKSLITHAVDIDEQKLINEVEQRLYTSKETAYKIVNNQFFKSSSYYTDYINMRINQFDTIKRMRLHFQRFNIPVEQMNVMADFTLCVSESSYYTDYINMRINQFDTIKRMRLHFQRFNIPVEQMNVMADFTLCVSENISEMNDCKSLLMDLEILRID